MQVVLGVEPHRHTVQRSRLPRVRKCTPWRGIQCMAGPTDSEGYSISRRDLGIAGGVAAGLLLEESVRRGLVLSQQQTELIATKRTGLSCAEVAAVVEDDLRERSYWLTGDLDSSVWSDDCRFKNPLTDVRGLRRYVTSIKNLFDPSVSSLRVDGVRVGPAQNQFVVRGEVQGVLQLSRALPWHPEVAPYQVEATYTLNKEGLIELYEETVRRDGAVLTASDILIDTIVGSK